jgi:hypothetical protein
VAILEQRLAIEAVDWVREEIFEALAEVGKL